MTEKTQKAKLEAVHSMISDMRRGIPPSKNLLEGDEWVQLLAARLVNFVPPFKVASKPAVHGEKALGFLLVDLEGKLAAKPTSVSLEQCEPLAVFKYLMTPDDQARIATVIDLVVQASATVALSAARKPRASGAGAAGSSGDACSSSTAALFD